MGFFDKPKSPAPSPNLQPWSEAKLIDPPVNYQKDLPLGWYVYQFGYGWYGLRPNSAQTELERSEYYQEPDSLASWLGVPLPEIARPKWYTTEELIKRQTAAATVEAPPPPPPGEAAAAAAETPAPVPPPRKKSSPRARCTEIHVRLSDAERSRLRRRVQQSGLNQSEFIRRAILQGKIMVEERNPVDLALLDELHDLQAELGRQGGMLKLLIKPNEGQRELAPEEWAELIQMIRTMEHTQKQLRKIGEKL